jgi:TRAP-type C4-dicarboxylate transport system substrate-binding protein
MERVSSATGIRYLGFVAERSPRVISTTKKPVVTVDDLKGLKIRVPGHPMYIRIFEYWGAIPTPMSPADMFMALKSGMVEGEDNGVINMVNGPNAEVIRHFTPINWNRSVVAAWISETRWKRLTDQERAWVSEAIERAQAEASVDFTRQMQESMQKLEQYGIQVHTPDLAGFLPVRDKITEQYEGTTWPAGQVGRIRALK